MKGLNYNEDMLSGFIQGDPHFRALSALKCRVGTRVASEGGGSYHDFTFYSIHALNHSYLSVPISNKISRAMSMSSVTRKNQMWCECHSGKTVLSLGPIHTK